MLTRMIRRRGIRSFSALGDSAKECLQWARTVNSKVCFVIESGLLLSQENGRQAGSIVGFRVLLNAIISAVVAIMLIVLIIEFLSLCIYT